MSAWTPHAIAPPLGSGLWFEIRVGDHRLATINIPDSDEGRSAVAKMVAALQMEEALEAETVALDHEQRWRMEGQPYGRLSLDLREKADALRTAALEAAKRLQP